MSRRRTKCRSGGRSGRVMPCCAVSAPKRNSASAGWRGHGRWWMSPRRGRPPPVDRVEGVALGQPRFERVRRGGEGRADRAIAPGEAGAPRAGMEPPALVLDPAVALADRHPCEEVRQMIPAPCQGDRDRVRRVEAVEVDTGSVAAWPGDVGADVELRECAEPRDGERLRAEADAAHAEGDNAHPRLSLVQIEFEPGGDGATKHVGLDRPVREEEIAPDLVHRERAFRRRPRAVRRIREGTARAPRPPVRERSREICIVALIALIAPAHRASLLAKSRLARSGYHRNRLNNGQARARRRTMRRVIAI